MSSSSIMWIDLKVPPTELRCENTLEIGQTFAWAKVGVENKWIGVIGNQAMILESLPNTTRVMMLNQVVGEQEEALRSVKHYLRLDDSLASSSLSGYYKRWSSHCPYFSKVAAIIPGVRILRQDVFETFISFIVSQNNNVARITQILARIRRQYGKKIAIRNLSEILQSGSISQKELSQQEMHTFPTIVEFIHHDPSVEQLRSLGLGYRAKYIRKIVDQLKAIYLKDGGDTMEDVPQGRLVPPSIPLADLILSDDASRSVLAQGSSSAITADQVVSELTRYLGVGRKVAECIALFACNCLDLVPVDTHVYQLAEKLGMITKKYKTATAFKAIAYDVIHKKFKERYGIHVGWAHSVLFAGELTRYRKLLEQKYGKDWDAGRHGPKLMQKQFLGRKIIKARDARAKKHQKERQTNKKGVMKKLASKKRAKPTNTIKHVVRKH